MATKFEIWNDSTDEVVHVEASSLHDAVESYVLDLVAMDSGMSDRFDVVAREPRGEWTRVTVSWEQRIDVTLGRERRCADPRGETHEEESE